MQELENQIKGVYKHFFKTYGIDNISGIIAKDTAVRFAGYPYVGRKYLEAKKRVLFYGLDLGSDECANNEVKYHTIETRREPGRVLGKDGIVGWHHNVIGAIYRISLGLLKDDHHFDGFDAMKGFEDRTPKYALRRVGGLVSDDVLNYIVFSNSFKFVSDGRKLKSGGQDRIYYDIEILKREVDILKPNIVVVMGNRQGALLGYLKTQTNIVCQWMPHPSARNGNNKIANYDEITNKIINILSVL